EGQCGEPRRDDRALWRGCDADVRAVRRAAGPRPVLAGGWRRGHQPVSRTRVSAGDEVQRRSKAASRQASQAAEGAMDAGEVSATAIAEIFRGLTLLLAPFAPFLAQELWGELGHEGAVFR